MQTRYVAKINLMKAQRSETYCTESYEFASDACSAAIRTISRLIDAGWDVVKQKDTDGTMREYIWFPVEDQHAVNTSTVDRVLQACAAVDELVSK